MSYLDYTLEMKMDADNYIAGKDTTITVDVSLRHGDKVVATMQSKTRPVTSSADVKDAFKELFTKFCTLSWVDRPETQYHDGEFVRVTSNRSLHMFPVGSIVKLITIDDDEDFATCDGPTWMAEGYTSAFGCVHTRWIGEDEFEKVGDDE